MDRGEEGERWVPQRVQTDFGVTDDIITLNNGQNYYFFKLPHKVAVSVAECKEIQALPMLWTHLHIC